MPPEAERSESEVRAGPTALVAWIVFFAVVAPSVAAVWTVDHFVTQDGPAHLYSGHIINESLGEDSPFRSIFIVRSRPLPNWAGHALLVALLRIAPADVADRIATTFTLLGVAASVYWLRIKVAGTAAPAVSAAYSTILALNCAWLFGFTSFLIGAMLFPIALGWWWTRRDEPVFRTVVGLCVLSVVGYFCHLVSLGLTAAGLLWMAVLSPGGRGMRRLAWTAAGLLPTIPLGLMYVGLTRSASEPFRPAWEVLRDPLSIKGWIEQLAWVDPISLASKFALPFATPPRVSGWFLFLAPAVWFLTAMLCLIPGSLQRRETDAKDGRGVWLGLGLFLILIGIVSPDGFGKSHGWYLPQRIVLLGLAALAPALGLHHRSRFAAAGRFALWVAWGLQTTVVWDYAVEASRKAERFLAAMPLIGENRKVASILIEPDDRFRANSLLHLDCRFGVGTGNVIWSDYETSHYYFPVRPIDQARMPNSREFDRLFAIQAPEDREKRASEWADLLDRHADLIDVAFVWGVDPLVEEINVKRFGRVDRYPGGSVWTERRVVKGTTSR